MKYSEDFSQEEYDRGNHGNKSYQKQWSWEKKKGLDE